MRKFISGSGADVTSTVVAYLQSTYTPIIFTAIKIQIARWAADLYSGTASYLANPILLTDCPAAFAYNPIGTFTSANIKHGSIPFAIGVEFPEFEVTWAPSPTDLILPAQVPTAFVPTPPLSIFQGVLGGMFDGAYVSIYKVVMPTYYDANTYGFCLLSTGMVNEVSMEGGEIKFKVGSIVDQQDQQIPSQLIGPNSRFASFDPLIYPGSDQRYGASFGATTLIADRTLTTASQLVSVDYPHVISGAAPTGFFDGGFVIWINGPLLAIKRNVAHSIFDPIALTQTFQLSEPYPYNANDYSAGFLVGFAFDAYSLRSAATTDPFYNGFPFVPVPEAAL